MKLHKHLLAAIAAVTLLGQVTAGACYIPVCKPNPPNCGGKPEVSDCGGGKDHHDKGDKCDEKVKIKIVVIIIIIKKIFGCW